VLREYEVLRVLDDPRIPRVYGHYPDLSAMAMGFVDGITLADIIHAASQDWISLEPATALDIAIEAAHALRHAHSMRFGTGSRIVHGHLGPQRIRLDPTGSVVLVGLGAAPHGRHPAYTAPEIARGALPTRAADQWSLGATLTEMILGERLYTGRRSPEDAAEEGDVRPWMDRVDRGHPEIGPALRKMLAKHPDDRFQSEPEMLKALLSASRRVGGTVHRRHLVAQVLIHSDKLDAMRPPRPPVTPLPLPPSLGARAPEVIADHAPHPEPEVWSMTDDTPDTPVPEASTPIEVTLDLDLDPPAGTMDIPIDGPELPPEPPQPSTPEPSPAPASEAAPPDSERPDLDPTAPLVSADPLSQSAPEPTAAFLPSEIIGMVAGAAMIGLGIWYCLRVL
jgi:serine/threonine protein kinase